MVLCSCGGACDFYPRSPCGERQANRQTLLLYAAYFYPRSPCGERPERVNSMLTLIQFLSTLSLRRATPAASRRKTTDMNFYPRSPCGERHHILDDTSGATGHFYPRSPCGERLNGLRHKWASFYFYPRSPCGERPLKNAITAVPQQISIHALLAESDLAERWTV